MKMMKKTLSIFTVLLFMVVPVFSTFGDGPKNAHVLPNVKIEGVDVAIPYGELVQVSVNAQDKVENLQNSIYSWKVYDENYRPKNVYVSEDGKKLIFGAGIKKTKFLAVLSATYTFVDKDDKGAITSVETLTTGISEAIIKIGDDDIVPPPPPVPPTPPTPPVPPVPPNPPTPLPDSPLGLVVPSVEAYSIMKAPTKATAAKLIAKNYNLVKNRIAGKEITTLKEAYAQLSDLNGKALRGEFVDETGNKILKEKGDFAEWNAWDQVIKKNVYDLYMAKKLVALEDYIGTFAEVANSLTYASENK